MDDSSIPIRMEKGTPPISLGRSKSTERKRSPPKEPQSDLARKHRSIQLPPLQLHAISPSPSRHDNKRNSQPNNTHDEPERNARANEDEDTAQPSPVSGRSESHSSRATPPSPVSPHGPPSPASPKVIRLSGKKMGSKRARAKPAKRSKSLSTSPLPKRGYTSHKREQSDTTRMHGRVASVAVLTSPRRSLTLEDMPEDNRDMSKFTEKERKYFVDTPSQITNNIFLGSYACLRDKHRYERTAFSDCL